MDKRPGWVCFFSKFSSANFSPYIDFPPVPCVKTSAIIKFPHDRSGIESHIATSEVTALEHELRDHTMELGSIIAKTLLASAKGTEILGGLRSDIVIEVEVDAAGLFYG